MGAPKATANNAQHFIVTLNIQKRHIPRGPIAIEKGINLESSFKVDRVVACQKDGKTTRCVDVIRPHGYKGSEEDKVLRCGILGLPTPNLNRLACSTKMHNVALEEIYDKGLKKNYAWRNYAEPLSICGLDRQQFVPQKCSAKDRENASRLLSSGIALAENSLKHFVKVGGVGYSEYWCHAFSFAGASVTIVTNYGQIIRSYDKSHLGNDFYKIMKKKMSVTRPDTNACYGILPLPSKKELEKAGIVSK